MAEAGEAREGSGVAGAVRRAATELAWWGLVAAKGDLATEKKKAHSSRRSKK